MWKVLGVNSIMVTYCWEDKSFCSTQLTHIISYNCSVYLHNNKTKIRRVYLIKEDLVFGWLIDEASLTSSLFIYSGTSVIQTSTKLCIGLSGIAPFLFQKQKPKTTQNPLLYSAMIQRDFQQMEKKIVSMSLVIIDKAAKNSGDNNLHVCHSLDFVRRWFPRICRQKAKGLKD